MEQKLRCLEAIGKAESPGERYVLWRMVETGVELTPELERRFAAEAQTHKEVRNMIITWEEALAAERAEGEARGVTEGELRAKRADIAFLLSHRFGSGRVPPEVEKRLGSITDLERLQGILEQALSVDSLDQLSLER